MKVILRPRKSNLHGQDYPSSLAAEKLQLTPVFLEEQPETRPATASQIDLAVTFDPHNERCMKWIDKLPQNIPVVSHFQLQWNYQKDDEQTTCRQTIKRSTAVIVPAKFLENDLSDRFPDKRIECIANGANREYFRPAEDFARSAFRKAVGIEDNDLLVLHVGPINAPKGERILYEVYRGLPKNCRLLIYCRQDAASVKAICALNEINPDRMLALYDHHQTAQANHPVRFCDALISCSLGEAAPMSVIEALLSGVPVIATKSTPFYDELKVALRDPFALQTVALPDRLHQLTADMRTLDQEEQRTVIDRLLYCINCLKSYRDDERRSLSLKMAAAGFRADTMLEGYKALYKSVSVA